MSNKITIVPKVDTINGVSFEITPDGDNNLPDNIHKIIEPMMEFYTKERIAFYEYQIKVEEKKWFNSNLIISLAIFSFLATILLSINLYVYSANQTSISNIQSLLDQINNKLEKCNR